MSDAKNIHQRLHAVMSEVDYVQKEKKAGMRYSIVSHDAVTAKVRPALVKHGIVYYPVSLTRAQSGNRTEMDLTVRFANIDDHRDFIDVVSSGYGVDDQDKGPGKAISYAVKYALLKALGLETGDDPELEQDAKHQPSPLPVKNAPPSPAAKTATHANGANGLGPEGGASSDLRLLANDIATAIKEAPNAHKLDIIMDLNQATMRRMPDTTQKYLTNLYEKRREAMESVI